MDEESKLFQMYSVVLEMVEDRGYVVPDGARLGKDQFRAKYGASRKDMSQLFRRRADPADMIFVHWCEELKMKVNTVRSYIAQMEKENVFRTVIVTNGPVSGYARDTILTMAPRFLIETFMETELLINITKHRLVPKHTVLSELEKTDLLARYKVKPTQLPRMLVTDPVARYYGLTKGQVVKIIRASETAGRYITYRIVV